MADCPTVIISRESGSEAPRAALEEDVATACRAAGWHVLAVPDIYHLPHGSDLWSRLSDLPAQTALVTSLYPRAALCLVREQAGLEPVATLDLREYASADEVVEELSEDLPPGGDEGELREHQVHCPRRWYPVFDRSRCINCGHCLQFCLFGVYERIDGRVIPVRPDNCKLGCPACARVCPKGAIMFPLSDEPAVAGAPGTIMRPDAAARRMYYVRTGRRCPVCGQVSEAGELAEQPEGVPACEECGRPLEEVAAQVDPSPVHDEIDDLIDALDAMAGSGDGGDGS